MAEFPSEVYMHKMMALAARKNLFEKCPPALVCQSSHGIQVDFPALCLGREREKLRRDRVNPRFTRQTRRVIVKIREGYEVGILGLHVQLPRSRCRVPAEICTLGIAKQRTEISYQETQTYILLRRKRRLGLEPPLHIDEMTPMHVAARQHQESETRRAT